MMKELTEQQLGLSNLAQGKPPHVMNPRTQEVYVPLPVTGYDRLAVEYDDSHWTREELEAIAREAASRRPCWANMDEYDDIPDMR